MNSIRTKLVIAALLISLVPLMIFGVITLYKTTDTLSASIENTLSTIVRSKESALESYLLNTQKTAQAFMNTAIVQRYIGSLDRNPNDDENGELNLLKDEVNNMLYNYMEQHWGVEYHHIFISDINGNIILSPDHFTNAKGSIASHLDHNIYDNPWFKPALNEVQVTDYSSWVETDHYHQLMLLPMKDKDGITKAVMGFELMIDHEHDILTSGFTLGKTGRVFLSTLDGHAVLHLKSDDPPHVNARGIEEAKKNNFYEGRSINENGAEVVGFYLKNEKYPWILVAEIETKEAFASIKVIKIFFYVALLITAILVLILAIILSLIITRPITRLRDTAKNILQGRTDERVHIDSGDEIGQLAESFNEMTDNLLESKKKVEIILESIGDGVVVIDTDKKLVMCNKMAIQLTGCDRGGSLGKIYNELLKFVYESDGKDNDEFIKTSLESGKIATTLASDHTMLIQKNGNLLPVECSAAPIKDKNGKILGCVIAFRDVSIARRIDKMKSEFVSIASHQLRTPLTSIKLFINLLASDDTGKFNTNQMEYISSIKTSSDRMVGLVNDLLNVSRLESGQIMIDPESISLSDFIDQTLKDAEAWAKEKGCKIIYKKEKGFLPKIDADTILLRQVVNNLLHNAVIYSPTGKGRIEVDLREDKNNYVISVKDNGIGIPKDVQPKIFGKFFRSDNAIKTVGDGSGLGLYLAKMIIDASGGKIWFDSEVGQGTIFYVSLPKNGMKKKKGEKRLADNKK